MNSIKDENRINSLLGTLNTDGLTPIDIKADPTAHTLNVSDGTTGADNGRNIAVRDDNRVAVLMAVSSADGITPIEVYADSQGKLLINSN